MPGYISLHRDIQKHWLYEEGRVFSRYEAWLDILMRVNHSEGKVTHNGTLETVLRGSTIWSKGDMEKHWSWSNSKVTAFLKRLENDGMLVVNSTTKKTYLTVINYEKYQSSDGDKTPPKHHQNATETYQKHTNNNELIITNNDKQKDTTATTEPNSFKLFELEGFGTLSSTIGEKIGYMIDDYGEPWVKEAMKEASYYGKRNLPYVKSILERYKTSGIDEPWNSEKIKPFPKGGQASVEKHKGSSQGFRSGSAQASSKGERREGELTAGANRRLEQRNANGELTFDQSFIDQLPI